MKKFFFTIAVAMMIGGICMQCSSSNTQSETPDKTQNANPSEVANTEKESPAETTTQSEEMETEVVNGKVNHLTQAEFIEKVFDYNDSKAVYTGETPIVVDCSACWCGWCQKLAPHLEALAAEYDGKIIFYEIDMDNAPDFGEAMNIEGLPTLLLIKSKSHPKKMEGYLEKAQLEKEFKKAFFR